MEGWLLVIICVVGVVAMAWKQSSDWDKTPPNPTIVCAHCQAKGTVKTRRVVRKRGVSGGKATGALLTGGVSMLGTGLSRNQRVTEMTCTSCGTIWDVA